MSTPFLKFGKFWEKIWISIPTAILVSRLVFVNNRMEKEIEQLKKINEERHHKEAGVPSLGDIQNRYSGRGNPGYESRVIEIGMKLEEILELKRRKRIDNNRVIDLTHQIWSKFGNKT
ncbi:hypothetical protein EAE96_003409 [Botrytis aclada]|nr:hypothetical protein EAE96_003409 [Botrytis aclada]